MLKVSSVIESSHVFVIQIAVNRPVRLANKQLNGLKFLLRLLQFTCMKFNAALFSNSKKNLVSLHLGRYYYM